MQIFRKNMKNIYVPFCGPLGHTCICPNARNLLFLFGNILRGAYFFRIIQKGKKGSGQWHVLNLRCLYINLCIFQENGQDVWG